MKRMNSDIRREERHSPNLPAAAQAVILFLLLIRPVGAATSDRNVLLVTIDTLRPDRLSCYSTEFVRTPAIDAIAGRGVVFERAFAHNPETLPSHANILLGTTSLYHGVSVNGKARVADDFLTLAERLKADGYSTGAFIGAFPLDSRFGLAQGFDVYDDAYSAKAANDFLYSERSADKVIASARKWLEGQKGKWFCWVHIWDPHAPYSPPEPYATEFQKDPYSGEVAFADAELAKLFRDIESKGWTGKTIVVITADHGEALGEHGELTHSYFAYNSTIWVPLIISAPGFRAARVKDHVGHVDIFPTICALLGIADPPFLQGVSLVPALQGKKLKVRDIYIESLDPYLNRGCAPLRGLVGEGKKFLETPIPELYDLATDFEEKTNLAAKAELGAYRKRLLTIQTNFSSPLKDKAGQRVDRETQERLKSLGYTVSPSTRTKTDYGPEDDIKTVFPFQQQLDRAILLSDQGKYEEAIAGLKDVIQKRKDFIFAYTFLAHIFMEMGLKEDSFKILDEGLRSNPQDYSLASAYGLNLIKEGRWAEAIPFLQKALGIMDTDPEAWNQLGLAYWRTNEPQKALTSYGKALSLDESSAMVYSNLGALYLSVYYQSRLTDDLNLAYENFKKAVSLDPEFALAFKSLGMAARESGKPDEAVASWEKALALRPNDDFVAKNLGLAYLEKGEKAKALELFNRYLAIRKNTLSPREREEIDALILQCKK